MYIYNGLILIRWRNILQDTCRTTAIQHQAMGSYNGVALSLSVLYLIDMRERSCVAGFDFGSVYVFEIRFWNFSGSMVLLCWFCFDFMTNAENKNISLLSF